jgi:hypothetical protein
LIWCLDAVWDTSLLYALSRVFIDESCRSIWCRDAVWDTCPLYILPWVFIDESSRLIWCRDVVWDIGLLSRRIIMRSGSRLLQHCEMSIHALLLLKPLKMLLLCRRKSWLRRSSILRLHLSSIMIARGSLLRHCSVRIISLHVLSDIWCGWLG